MRFFATSMLVLYCRVMGASVFIGLLSALLMELAYITLELVSSMLEPVCITCEFVSRTCGLV